MSNKPIKLKIKGKNYQLKFGYSLIKVLCGHFQIASVTKFFDFVQQMFDESDQEKGIAALGIEAIDFVSNLMFYAIDVEDHDALPFSADEMVDLFIFTGSPDVQVVITEFFNSLPKGEGKPKAPANRQARRKQQKAS